MTVICYIKRKDGKYYKKKSKATKKDGKFTVNQKTYDQPQHDKDEILELRHWLMGLRQYAYYREGTPTPIPLVSGAKWRNIENPDDDKDFLAAVVKQALFEKMQLEQRLNMTLGGQGLIILLLMLHWLW